MENFVDNTWREARYRYKPEELFLAMPRALARELKERAEGEGRALAAADCALIYREPNGDINIHAVREALEKVDELQGVSQITKISAKAELHSALLRANLYFGNNIDESAPTFPTSAVTDLERAASAFLSEVKPIPVSYPVSTPISTRSHSPAKNPAEELLAQIGERPDLLRPEAQAALANPYFQTAILNLAETPEGGQMLDAAVNYMANPVAHNEESLLLSSPRKMDFKKGVIESDFRPLPNFRKLGIDREAGIALPDEITYAKGQLKKNGDAVRPEDFFSTGALIANSDVIPMLMSYIPASELERLKIILETRSKKSDTNHSRDVESGYFTIVMPKVGTDPGTKLHVDHPRLGKEPYTALVSRLLYPLAEEDEQQLRAVERVRRGRLQNLSLYFTYTHKTCGLCGEMEITKTIIEDGNLLGFQVDPSSNRELFRARGEDEYFYRTSGVLRIPMDIEGGCAYRNITVTEALENGTVLIDPMPSAVIDIAPGTVFLNSMERLFYWGGGPTYCQLHMLCGSYLRDGRRVVSAFTNVTGLVNTAHVDAGAINDARVVLHPDVRY